MKGLILKDIYSLMNLWKQIVMMLLIFTVCFAGTADGALISVCIVVCTIFVSTTFSLDEACGWDKYALAMPVTRGRLVTAKYITAALFCVTGILLGAVATLIGSLLPFGDGKTDPDVLLAAGSAGLVVALIIVSFSIPVSFQYGATKSRYVLMGVVALPMLVIFGFQDFAMGLGEKLAAMPTGQLVGIGTAILVIIVLVSYEISLQIIKKKEF